MSKSVCILATDYIHQHTRSFIDAVSQSTDMQDIRFVVLVDKGNQSTFDFSGSSHIDIEEIPHSLAESLKQLDQQQIFDCIVANTLAEHEVAVEFKKERNAKPVYVVRNRLAAEPILRTKEAKRFHNKLTDINCFFEDNTRFFYNPAWERIPEIKALYEEKLSKDELKQVMSLKNPCALNQQSLGEDHLKLMVEHVFLSLFYPTRQHKVSGSKRSYSHIKVSYVTHFYCNQEGIGSVTELLEKYAGYADDVLDHTQFIIVDDGSPIDYEIPDLPLNLTWLKVKEDIRWNQSGARNLGVLYAKSDNVICTDLDHEFPEETLRGLINRGPVGRKLYKFRRKNPETSAWERGHPNIFYFSKGNFFKHFGYDEEFAGGYGAEDYRIVKFLKGQGMLHWHLPKQYYCMDRPKIDRDKHYHTLIRDLSFNTPVDARKNLEMALYGHKSGHSRMMLEFEWEKICDRLRPYDQKPKVDKNWKKYWLLGFREL